MSYTITDALGATATTILHIKIIPDLNNALNNPPIPHDDFAITDNITPVTSSFINNDWELNYNPITLNGITIDATGAQTPIGLTIITTMGGSIQYFSDGTYTYTPPSGYVGPDHITYSICDVTSVNPQPLCDTATIHFLTRLALHMRMKYTQ